MSRRADLQVYRAFSLAGGLDVKTSPLALALRKNQDRLVKADNMVYTTSGAVTKRYDRTKINTTTLGASVAITGGIQFRHSNGTDYTVCGTDDGRLVTLNSDGTTTNIKTGLTTGSRYSFAVYNDKMIVATGAEAPRKWDGTTEGALGGSPPATAQFVAVHGNRVHFLDNTTKSTWTWSALNNEEDYTTASNAGSTVVAANDSSRAIALVPSISEMVILKGSRPYRVQGTSPSTFTIASVVPTTGSIGAVSFQAAVFALNDVWWLSEAGIHNLSTTQQFGDLREKYVSDRVAPYFQPSSGFTVSLNRLNLAVGVYDSQWNRLLFSVDTDNDSKNDITLVYDILTQAWSKWDFGFASAWVVRNSSDGIKEVFVGGYDGFVRALTRSVATNAIDGHVRHISCLGSPGVEKSPRYTYLYLKEEGNYSVTVDTKFDFGATGGQTYTISLLGGSHTLGVNWVLGTDALGSKDQIVKRIDMSGTGEFLEIGVRNQNAGEPFTLHGYETLYRPRRIVRRGTAA